MRTILFLLHFGVAVAQAQPPTVLPGDGSACEIFQPLLMDAYRTALEKNEKIFVIASLGKGEHRQQLNHARLGQIEMLMELRQFKPEIFVLVQGKRVSGPGQLEVYVGSQLYFTVQAYPGAYVCVACCDQSHNAQILKPKKRKGRRG